MWQYIVLVVAIGIGVVAAFEAVWLVVVAMFLTGTSQVMALRRRRT